MKEPIVANILCHSIELRGISPSDYEHSTRFEHQYSRIIQDVLGLPVIHFYLTQSNDVIRHQHMWGYPMVGCPISWLTRSVVTRPDRNLSASFSGSLLDQISTYSSLKILHIHAYHILQHDLLSWRFPSKVIISHDHGDPGWLKPLYFMRILTWLTLRFRSAAIVVQSHKETQRRLFVGIPQNKVNLIFPGVDENVFVREDRETARKRLGLNIEDFIFVFSGVLYHRKGVDLLIRAFAELVRHTNDPHLKLIILGSGAQVEEYKALAASLSTLARISFMGNVDHAVMPIYLSASDVFVAPSRAEPQGKMNLEAMMCGLPVISTNNGGTPETVLHEKTGILVPPDNVFQLYQSMLKLYSNPAYRLEMGETAYQYAHENFGWKKSAARLRDVYTRLGLLASPDIARKDL